MSAQAFRFLHAADLHLDDPLSGLAEIPTLIRDLLVDAPLLAAKRVFDAAIQRQVDFVILSGDVVRPQLAGTYILLELIKHFERLDERGIVVYWCAGSFDSQDAWPSAVKLPKNVHLLSSPKGQTITHQRQKTPVASISDVSGLAIGRIRPADLAAGRGNNKSLFTIAVAHGRADADKLAKLKADYWALSGHQQYTKVSENPAIHYPGSPQGRLPGETGPHGCLVASVDAQRAVKTTPVATDVVRWHSESVQIKADATLSDFKDALGERALGLIDDSGDRAMLVSWRISGPTQINTNSGYRQLSEQLVAWLRNEFGAATPALWTVSVNIEPPTKMPKAWRSEETILGEFLRSVRHYVEHPNEPLDLNEYLSEDLADSLAATVRLNDPVTRKEVLREATLVGVDLLRGDEAS